MDLQEQVKAALSSPKVDAYMLQQYLELLENEPGVDLTEAVVPFLAQIGGHPEGLIGQKGSIGDIYQFLAPYSSLPDLIARDDVLNLEASRPGYL